MRWLWEKVREVQTKRINERKDEAVSKRMREAKFKYILICNALLFEFVVIYSYILEEFLGYLVYMYFNLQINEVWGRTFILSSLQTFDISLSFIFHDIRATFLWQTLPPYLQIMESFRYTSWLKRKQLVRRLPPSLFQLEIHKFRLFKWLSIAIPSKLLSIN